MIGMNGISAPRALMPILVPVNDWLSKPFFVFNGLFETSIIESGESVALLLVCLIAAVFISQYISTVSKWRASVRRSNV